MENITETEQRIIASAEKLFYQNGKAGTSMQDIADDAGINRTLLNYYFRSKDKLFEAVFRTAMSRFVPGIASLLNSDLSFTETIPRMIETVIDTLLENPQIPIFVLQELTSNPGRMPQMVREMGVDASLATRKIQQEHTSGEGVIPDPQQVVLNLLCLCIFPFAARPVVTEVLFGGSDEAFIHAMKMRKNTLPGVVEQMITQKS